MKNSKFNTAKDLHKQIEVALMGCKEFEGTEQYPGIIDSLTKVLKLLTELKINYIKNENIEKID